MCGIVGIFSTQAIDVERKTFNKLKLLEYRGYDSFGIISTRFEPKKFIGAVSKANIVDSEFNYESKIAIAHTRWATHGQVSLENTHPHASMRELFYVVHNGVVSNYESLKSMLEKDGYTFRSATDTEVISNLLEYCYTELNIYKPIQVVDAALKFLEGEFAICVMCREWSNTLVCAKNKSPLLFSANSKYAVLASDEIALSEEFETCADLDDNEILQISEYEGAVQPRIFSRTQEREVAFGERFRAISRSSEAEALGHFSNYMSKEMSDIPSVLSKVYELELEDLRVFLRGKRVVLTGCGSAYYACLIGNYVRKLETPNAETLTIPADEFENLYTYREGDVLLCISQSGETFDTLEPARHFQGDIVVVTNVAGSSLANLSTYCVVQSAGVERCVLSTKSIVSQCAILYAMFSENKNWSNDLKLMAPIWEVCFKDLKHRIEEIANTLAREYIDHLFFVGRGIFNAVAMENALKFKEVTYCHAEGMAAGFFKHGTLSLIDERFVTFAHLPFRDNMPELYDLTKANIEEIRARNGLVILVGHDERCDVKLPTFNTALDAILHLGFGQYVAYFMALALGRDVDQPRSLAKSVTVR